MSGASLSSAFESIIGVKLAPRFRGSCRQAEGALTLHVIQEGTCWKIMVQPKKNSAADVTSVVVSKHIAC